MKQFIVLSVLCGCLAAGQVWSLEAVALPSDGAGSGNGAATYALGNQLSANNAVITAQGNMLQQVNGQMTSLTTTVNTLEQQVQQLVSQNSQLSSQVSTLTQQYQSLASETGGRCAPTIPGVGSVGAAISVPNGYLYIPTSWPGCGTTLAAQCQGGSWRTVSINTGNCEAPGW